ncbi:hypothetical protein [Blastococcus xanthinilyticus]|uniref:Uncharacterized protein n=1 Tax=Blastococcus xanthinilyticus TaxID=1564164 RepID=A0A5S5CQW3_9ACTN|nr:hypothetical protein [Blastococcus xanthinilyticus]TYP82046.1 hypothetical protein BD833_12030 [Blastococcus xanthinilyticus]
MMADREQLITAIDELHERAWRSGEDGDQADRRAAEGLASALGWQGWPGSTPDGGWVRARLSEALR